MDIFLPPDLESLVKTKVESGLYNSASEVMREALRLLEERDQLDALRREALRRDIQEGIDSGESSPLDMEAIKARGRARLAALASHRYARRVLPTEDEVAPLWQRWAEAGGAALTVEALLAGSTEIGLKVNKQFFRPEHLIYLGHVAELQQVQTTPQSWRIGAMVSLERVLELVKAEWPDFAEVLRRFGSPPIRSTATLAGNIANGSPIGDSMPCLMALGATLVLRRGSATRRVALDAFYTGMKASVLQPDEFIEAVELPRATGAGVFAAHKVSKRFDQDISAICAAMHHTLVEGRLSGVRLAVNGVTPFPQRVPAIEALLEGREPASVTAAEVDAAVAAAFPARDGLRGTWAYRSLVARNLVMQFVEDAADASTAVTA